MEVKEKVVLSESVQVEERRHRAGRSQRLRASLEAESRGKRELDAEVSRLEAKLSEPGSATQAIQGADFLVENHKLQLERQSLQLEARRLQSEIEVAVAEAQGLRSLPTAAGPSPGHRPGACGPWSGSWTTSGGSPGAHQEIEELQRRLACVAAKREQRENHPRSIVATDPDSGRELSPEEAHRAGLIDWNMFVKLRSQECDWGGDLPSRPWR